MSDPIIVRRVRCPECRSPWTKVVRTAGRTQYRTCLSCERPFKAIRELPDEPDPRLQAGEGDRQKA